MSGNSNREILIGFKDLPSGLDSVLGRQGFFLEDVVGERKYLHSDLTRMSFTFYEGVGGYRDLFAGKGWDVGGLDAVGRLVSSENNERYAERQEQVAEVLRERYGAVVVYPESDVAVS